MKINKLFHWLYFFVMALPIVVAPIFALYTTNKNVFLDNSIQVEEDKVINYNQYFSLDNFSTFEAPSPDVFTIHNVEYFVEINGQSTTSNRWQRFATIPNLQAGHKVYFRTLGISTAGNIGVRQYLNGNVVNYVTWFNTVVTIGENDFYDMYCQFLSTSSAFQYNFYLGVFDLTQMFGEGNEPSISDFNSIFTEYNYEFSLGKDILLPDSTVTYSDTDVGSQFIYTMYNCVDKYFNYDRVFNFGDLYIWLNTTFFSGQAPLGFFVFWHLLIYWLLTSLLWLVFDVLMYVPQLVHRWLDKASIS